MRHDRVGGYDGTVDNSDVRYLLAHPHIMADALLVEIAAAGVRRCFWRGPSMFDLTVAVIVIADDDAADCEHVIANHHLLYRSNMDGIVDPDITTYVQHRRVATRS